MDNDLELLRQVYPDWFKDGIVSSQVFNPSEEHGHILSSYSKGVFTAETSFNHYTGTLRKESCGCLAVTNGEYLNHDLNSTQDNEGFEGHVSTDFSPHGSSQRSKKAKLLRNIAVARGWLFRSIPVPSAMPDEDINNNEG